MRNASAILVRYFGSDCNRYHVLQRASGDFFTGDGWSRILDCAKISRKHGDAQRASAVLQRRQYGGLPMRTFRVEAVIALVARDVTNISDEQLADYIESAVRLEIESSQFGDGPVTGSYVQVQFRLATLEETKTTRERF